MDHCEDCGAPKCDDCRTHYCLDYCPCMRSHTCGCECDAYDRYLTDAE